MTVDFSSARWRKSSRSSQDIDTTGVELADLGSVIGGRDSKDPGGPKLALTRADFTGLARRVKAGRLEL